MVSKPDSSTNPTMNSVSAFEAMLRHISPPPAP